MRSNSKKLWLIFPATLVVLALAFLVGHPTGSPKIAPAPFERAELAPSTAPGSRLLSEVTAEKAKNGRKVRSPALVAGSRIDLQTKEAVDRMFAEPQWAALNDRLRSHFPDHSPLSYWIRASLILATKTDDREVTREQVELGEKIYEQILSGDEAVVAALDSALVSIPRTESALRRQSLKMLSDVAMNQRGLREAVKIAMISEAHRAGNHPDAALALTALLRVSPTKEWFNEVNRSYGRLHPGADLSDFVALKVVSL